MPHSAYTQHSFLGGEWSPQYQGRLDQPTYHTALNVCINAIPVAEGPAARRSGTQVLGPTYLRGPAKLLPLISNSATPFMMEITTTGLQFYYGTGPVCTNDYRTIQTSSSSSGVYSVTLDGLSGWAVGDDVILVVPPPTSTLSVVLSEQTANATAVLFVPNSTAGIAPSMVATSSAAHFPTGTVTVSSVLYPPGPVAATTGTAVSGALAGATYYVRLTYLDAFGGETAASPVVTQVVATNSVLTVTSPAAATGMTQYNIYAATTSGSNDPVLQATVNIGTGWQEPNTGLIAGVTVPASPTVSTRVTISSNSTGIIASGSTVVFGPPVYVQASTAPFAGRRLKITTADTVVGGTVVFKDDLGNALPFDISSGDLDGCQLLRILRFVTSYPDTSLLPQIRAVQAQKYALLLSSQTAPQTITVTADPTDTTDAIITFAATAFVDGPYLDPQLNGAGANETGVVSGYSGSITYTPTASLSPLSTTFSASDVGRHIRLFTQPAAWASGTTYTNGETVTDAAGNWWVFTYSTGLAGVIPGTSVVESGLPVYPWAPLPTAGQWAWGKITAQATTSCTVSLVTPLNSANGTTVSICQLGLFTAGSYPTCGIFHKGRLWLLGAAKNRIDGSTTTDLFTFSPTDIYDDVPDSSAISYTVNSDSLNTFNWVKADRLGLVAGTIGGEWLFSASTLNDPMTPTSFDGNQVNKDGSAAVEPVRIGMAIAFVQRYARRLIEFLADAFTQLYSGRPLNEFAKHITESGVKEVAYQEELAPVIWSLNNDGTLAGCTYRRVSRFVTEPPVFQGWHNHMIADGNVTTTSIAVTPAIGGLSDMLYLCTEDSNGYYWVEVMRPLYESV